MDWFGGVSVLAPSPADRRPAAPERELPLLSLSELKGVLRAYLARQPQERREEAIEALDAFLGAEAAKLRPAGPVPERDERRIGYVYFIRNPVSGLVKIGASSGNPHERMRQLQIGAGCALEMLGYIAVSRPLERQLHEHFREARRFGEWFRATPELLAYITYYAGNKDGAR